MSRDILSDQTQKADSSQVTSPASHSLSSPPAKDKDTLAGAFPEWDLLPKTQFIRRVK